MYGSTHSEELFADELTEWLLEADFIQPQCYMSIYYKYSSYGTNFFVLSYIYDCVYWYTYETTGKWFLDTSGKRFHVKLLGYTHWFMSIRISHMMDHSIYIDQARYATSVVAKYLDTAIVEAK